MKIKILNYEFKPLITDYKIIKKGKPTNFLTEQDKKLLLKPLININFDTNEKRR